MYSVGIVLLKNNFQNCIVLVRQGSLLCRRSCVSLSQDWVLEALVLFLAVLYSTDVRGVGANKVCQKLAMRRGFEVRGFYHSLSPSFVHSFCWKFVWQSKVSPRVAFFYWTTALGNILTTDNLQKRHIIVLDWCYMCKWCGELVNHLLLHCPIAYELWSMVFSLFGIHWVMPYKVIELLAS